MESVAEFIGTCVFRIGYEPTIWLEQKLPSRISKILSDAENSIEVTKIFNTANKIIGAKGISINRPPLGIPNVGSTCYMNSILQCLGWSPCLINLLAEEVSKKGQNVNAKGMAECLLMLLNDLHQSDKKIVDRKLVVALLNSARKINDQFKGYNQQDSFEIFNTILSGMDDDEDENGEEVEYERNKVLRLFSGTFVIVYYYSDCEHVQLVKQKHTSLSIPFPVEEILFDPEGNYPNTGSQGKECVAESQTDTPDKNSTLDPQFDGMNKVEGNQTDMSEKESTNYVPKSNENCNGGSKSGSVAIKENIKTLNTDCEDKHHDNGESENHEGSLKQTPFCNDDDVRSGLLTRDFKTETVNVDVNTQKVKDSQTEKLDDHEHKYDNIIQSKKAKDSLDHGNHSNDEVKGESYQSNQSDEAKTSLSESSNVTCTTHSVVEATGDQAIPSVESHETEDAHESRSNDQNDNMKQIYENDIPLALSLTRSNATDSSGVEKGLEILTKVEMFSTASLNCRVCEQNKQENKDNSGMCYKVLRLYELPPVLVLHVNRFRQVGEKLEKIQKSVSYPKVLDVTRFCLKYMEQGEDANRKLYALYGVASHKGKLSGGHYYAHVKTRNLTAENIRKRLDQDSAVDKTTPMDIKVNIENLIKAVKEKSTQHILSGIWDCREVDESKKSSTSTCDRWYTISDSYCREITEEYVLDDSNAYVLMYERI